MKGYLKFLYLTWVNLRNSFCSSLYLYSLFVWLTEKRIIVHDDPRCLLKSCLTKVSAIREKEWEENVGEKVERKTTVK